jgi:hypothetical protein
VPKIHNKPIKKDQEKGSNKRAKGQSKAPWSGAPDCPVCHRTVSGAPPDNVRCTRELDFQLFTFGNFQRHFAIIHRTVWCTTGQCPVLQKRATLNSLASGIRSAKIHRTVRCDSGATASSRATVDCNTLNARLRAQRSRARAGGTPDSLQGLSGAPPDSQAGPQDRAPTVETLRPGDVASAPDSVRWRTGLSGAPCDRSLHQRSSLVVGAINTPNHPHIQVIQVFHLPTTYKSSGIQF